jgi:hypothetical protein
MSFLQFLAKMVGSSYTRTPLMVVGGIPMECLPCSILDTAQPVPWAQTWAQTRNTRRLHIRALKRLLNGAAV